MRPPHAKSFTLLQAKHFQDIACGLAHSMAVTDDGDVLGWGGNANRQVDFRPPGKGQEDSVVPVPRPVLLGNRVVGVACGAGHTLCVTTTGKAIGWGLARNGQLGNYRSLAEADMFVTEPVQIHLLEPVTSPQTQSKKSSRPPFFTATACGFAHSFFLDSGGSLYGCGWNAHGQVRATFSSTHSMLFPFSTVTRTK